MELEPHLVPGTPAVRLCPVCEGRRWVLDAFSATGRRACLRCLGRGAAPHRPAEEHA